MSDRLLALGAAGGLLASTCPPGIPILFRSAPSRSTCRGSGLFYAVAYHRTGSLLAPMLVHNIGNGTIVVAMWTVRAWMTR